LSDWRVSIAALMPLFAFMAVMAVMPAGIRWLRLLHFGQNIRADGPESHKSKAGTPTMGGVLFVPAAVLFALLFDAAAYGSITDAGLLLALFTVAGLAIGWFDDFRSVKRGKSLGLKAREKLVLQFAASALFLGGMVLLNAGLPGSAAEWASIPVAPAWLPWRFLFLAVVCVWLINAANIADGLDGLAAGQSVIAIAGIYVFARGGQLMQAPNPWIMGACVLAFLWYNAPPARLFMGDAGSIALGCFIAGYGILTAPLWVLLLATAVWSLEALSVVIQVVYFKFTGGKRIFRMSPIHHHFELCGWPETQVTVRFWIASALLGLLVPGAIALMWGVR